ncbi:MAG TPA: DUF2239 family protein [Alkalispirochaeta sp.]|nr:DUF2239 family protein [Alkalispirochaeta sp.]
MSNELTYTVFAGSRQIAAGELLNVLSVAHTAFHTHHQQDAPILFFRNDTGRQVEFDLSGELDDLLQRFAPEQPKKGPGRPRMGVQCGEVCLLPRHWEWLERRPKRASATLRLLVEQAMKNMSPEERVQERVEAVHSVMWVLAGDRVGFEEASRALYAQKWEIFHRLIAPWPEDIVTHLQRMLNDVPRT